MTVIDEYAELVEDAPTAVGDADSIARRGRAVAVTLIAATQRPTQKAMGKSAVRSQMDVRIAFRVRERKDVDLILGQGMLAAGWHAHTLNAPGKFLLSAPEHDTPRRARAYLLDDETVSDTATRNADARPVLDEVSTRALERRPTTPNGPLTPSTPDDARDPQTVLWAALRAAPPEGVAVSELMTVTGMSRPWVYLRLRELADRRQVL